MANFCESYLDGLLGYDIGGIQLQAFSRFGNYSELSLCKGSSRFFFFLVIFGPFSTLREAYMMILKVL